MGHWVVSCPLADLHIISSVSSILEWLFYFNYCFTPIWNGARTELTRLKCKWTKTRTQTRGHETACHETHHYEFHFSVQIENVYQNKSENKANFTSNMYFLGSKYRMCSIVSYSLYIFYPFSSAVLIKSGRYYNIYSFLLCPLSTVISLYVLH